MYPLYNYRHFANSTQNIFKLDQKEGINRKV